MFKKWMAVIGLLCFALPAWAQANWDELPCDQAYLAWEPALKCLKSNAARGGADDQRAVTARFQTFGNISGISLRAHLTWPVGDGTFLGVYTTDAAVRAIKGLGSGSLKDALWGEPRGFGNVTYMTLTAGNQSCVGFDQAGPLFEYGYAWHVLGIACKSTPGSSAGIDDPDAFVKDVLGALRVGPPGSNKNALGETLRAYRWPGSSS